MGLLEISILLSSLLGLVLFSFGFGWWVSNNPPKQKHNVYWVIGGVSYTLAFLLPAQYAVLDMYPFVALALTPIFFTISLGIVSMAWLVAHRQHARNTHGWNSVSTKQSNV